jgi:hypothetical protein
LDREQCQREKTEASHGSRRPYSDR